MKRIFLVLFILAGTTCICISQTSVQQPSTNIRSEKSLEEKLEGTYIFIKKDPKVKMMISRETLRLIESKRDLKKDIFLFINDELTIQVLPWSIINAADFDSKKYKQ